MNQQLLNDISKYVEDHIGEFHAARIAKLQNMNLKEILKRKNPYQIKAMRAMTVGGFVEFLIDDALYKINNDLFKDWMTDVALFVLQTIGNSHCEAPTWLHSKSSVHLIIGQRSLAMRISMST